MNKRTHAGLSACDTPMIRIKLANESEAPVEADKRVVQLFSGLAGELPDSDEWDLTSFIIDGKPVERSALVAWLNAVYSMLYRSPFEQQEQHPAGSMEGLCQMLAFADAVKSPKGLLESCVSDLDSLMLCAKLGNASVQLHTNGRAYFFYAGAALQLAFATATGGITTTVAISEEEKQAFIKEVARQTEQLLFMAYKLQLSPLISRLHAFVRCGVVFPESLLYSKGHDVFSERVLDAAVGFNKVGRQAHITGVLSGQQWTCTSTGTWSAPNVAWLLRPTNLTEQQKQPIEFEAELQQDHFGIPKGSVVPVKLHLFNKSTMDIGTHTLRFSMCNPTAGNYCSV